MPAESENIEDLKQQINLLTRFLRERNLYWAFLKEDFAEKDRQKQAAMDKLTLREKHLLGLTHEPIMIPPSRPEVKNYARRK